MPRQALLLGGMTKAFHQFWTNGPALREVLEKADFEVFLSEDLEVLASPGLEHYDVVVNLTTGRQLSPPQWEGLAAFVRGGKALVGVHNAADTFKNVPEYIAMLGGRFVTHPPQLDIAVRFTDPTHPIIAGLEPFVVHDELYILEWDPARVHLLAETTSFEQRPIPIAWTREEGAGRVFYFSLGHNRSTYDHPGFAEMLRRGALWAVGA